MIPTPTSKGNTVPSSHQGAMYLGEVSAGVAQTLEAARAAVDARSKYIQQLARECATDYERYDLLYLHDPLDFEEYTAILRRIDRILQAIRANRDTYEEPAAMWLAENFNRRAYTANESGWLSYLSAKHPAFFSKLQQVKPAALSESTRQKHTLIAAPNGWGKTELLKAPAHHYVASQSAAVVIIDPHGDMARQIAQWPELHKDGRMVFLRQAPSHGSLTASLNPFDTHGLPPHALGMLAEHIAGALSEMVPESELTPRMHTAVRNCARVLLDVPGATLQDLRHMMKDKALPRTKELIQTGQRHRDNELAEYFSDKFPTDRMTVSKDGIWDRMDDLLGDKGFRRWFCNPSTASLHDIIKRRQFLIMDISDLSGKARKTGGRLTLAMLAGIGSMRLADPRIGRTPVHVIVDEVNDLVGPSVLRILQEMRKAGIHLTMAQQVAGQGLSSDGRASLFQNTAVKLMGGPLSGDVARIIGAPRAGVAPLSPGEFWGVWGQENEPFRLTVRRDLAQHHEKTSPGAWDAVIRKQLADYYRNPPPPPAPRAPEPAPQAAERPQAQPGRNAQGQTAQSTNRRRSSRPWAPIE